MRTVSFYDPDFRLQQNTAAGEDRFLHDAHQVHDVRRGLSRIDNKSGMKIRDPGAAAGKPLETRSLDQRPGKMACRPPEKASGAGILQGLACRPPLGEIPDLLADIQGIAGDQSQLYAKDRFIIFLKQAVAVSKVQVPSGAVFHYAAQGNSAGRMDDLSHFAAISAAIHINGAAYAAGDAAGKFHAGQTGLRRCPGHGGQLGARFRKNHIPFDAHTIQTASDPHNDAIETGVVKNQIASVSHDQMPRTLLTDHLQRAEQFGH